MVKKIPINCPACAERLSIEKLTCGACNTSIQGSFSVPLFLQLPADDQTFILTFLKASGSLKEMAKQLGYSYPKVRNMLDDVIDHVKKIEHQTEPEHE